jgi:hypothetical protein
VKGTAPIGKEAVVQETEGIIEIRQIAADQTKIVQEIHEAAGEEEEIVNEVVIIEVIEKTKVIIGQTGIEVTEEITGTTGMVIGIGIEDINEAADVADHVIEIKDHVIEITDQGVRIGFLARILTRKKTLVKALQGIKKWKELTRKQAALRHPHPHLHQRQI